MIRLRASWRWLLTLVALVAIIVAVLSSGVRLAAWQIDRLSLWLTSVVEDQLHASARLGHLSLTVHRLNPRLALNGFRLDTRDGQPLLNIDHAAGRLETLASWRLGAPVLRGAEIEGLTLHLYQAADGRWAWPDGAGSRWFGGTDDSSSSSLDIDGWLRLLARQQARLENVTLVLHGKREQASVSVSQLTLASRNGQASIQATLSAGEKEAGHLHLAIESGGESQPGDGGTDDHPRLASPESLIWTRYRRHWPH
ncbi:hypothetical protein CUR86_14965 [Salinicola acroporae]|uniref:YhdP central domain-containing protein n=2 Tax=Salinicola acroporae TaxID=1541440 RepID=A0ABT6I781_9GAMM|nr:hypothetical protein [Salinicola acroporae]